ncbi:MAG TPA: two-component regulator propeller domain-containing protein [Bacteroidales bacterium]|nr:two-component regulator propeller domain-containing protein [Bacteroidales bacterium]
MAKDSAGGIWIGTYCGLIHWQGNNWIKYTPQNSILVSSITALHYSNHTHALYAGLFDGKVLKIDAGGWSYLTGNLIAQPSGWIKDIEVDTAGTVWALPDFDGIYKFDGTDWTHYNTFAFPLPIYPQSIAIDDSGILWVLTSSRLYSYDGINWTLRTTFSSPGTYGYYLSMEANNTAWISARSGLILFDGTSCFPHPANPLLTGPDIIIHLVRKNGEILTGMRFDGVDRISGLNITNYTLAPDLISNRVFDIAFDDTQGKVWFATNLHKVHESFAVSYNDTVWENITPLNSPISGASTTSIAVDGSSNLYLGTGNQGLWVRQAGNWQNFNTQNSSISSDSITAMAVDKNNRLLIGFKNGSVQLKTTNIFSNMLQLPNPSCSIRRILPENNTTFWVATATAGLVQCNYGPYSIYNSSNSGLPSNRIADICIDHLNHYWIGTDSSGLVHFDGTNWAVYSANNSGLQEDLIEYITMAPDSSLWVSTAHQGIGAFKNNNWTYFDDCQSLPAMIKSGGVMRTSSDGRIVISGSGVTIVSFNNVICIPDSIHHSQAVTITPNPGKSAIIFRFSQSCNAISRFIICNSCGQRIFEKTIFPSVNDAVSVVWDTNDGMVPAGIYYYILEGDTLHQSGKVIVQK